MSRTLAIFTIVGLTASFCLSQNRPADSRPAPKLYFKKTNKEVTDGRGTTSKIKLADPKNAAKVIDVTVENIGKTEGLVVLEQSLDEKYNNWKVVIKNKGIVKSNNAVYAVVITKYVSEKLTAGNPIPKTISQVIYQEYKVLPKLNPNEQMTTWFSFKDSGMPGGNNPFAGMFSNLGSTNTSYKIDTYFVTEPIIFK